MDAIQPNRDLSDSQLSINKEQQKLVKNLSDIKTVEDDRKKSPSRKRRKSIHESVSINDD